MQLVFIELSKYAFAFLLVFYALASYRGAIIKKDNKLSGICLMQQLIMFLIHFLGYMILFVVFEFDYRYMLLYVAELIYFMVVILFIKIL